VAARERVGELAAGWRRRGHDLALGVGIAVGYATLGRIGFEGRYDYGAVGRVTILASRLSDLAPAGQVLLSQRAYAAVEDLVQAEPAGALTLKGFSRPEPAFSVLRLREAPPAPAARGAGGRPARRAPRRPPRRGAGGA
jgi:class 3 adenylate cyclase